MKELLGSLYDGGILSSALASLDKGQSSLPGFGAHSNGMDVSLISAADAISWDQWKKLKEAADFVQANDVSVGTTTDGDPYVEVRNNEGVQTHVAQSDGTVSSFLINNTNLGGGASVMFWSHLTNGVVDSYGKRVTNADGSTEYWEYDANGNETGHGKTPPKTTPGGNTNGPTTQPQGGGTTGNAPTGGTTSTGGATETATEDSTSKPTTTSSATYSNPDADPFVMPTDKQIADRIAFLTGVRVHTVENKPQVSSTLVPKPGVSDPADPECKGSMCVFFVEVVSPDFTNVAGGDPVPPDLANRTPPLR